jgi:hypothetical protein
VVGNRSPRLGLEKAVVENVQRNDTEACGGDLRLGLRGGHLFPHTVPACDVVRGDAHRASVP